MANRSGGPGGISAERLEVLRMVEAKTITPDEGARLLESLDRSDRRQMAAAPPVPDGPRNVRIQVTAQGEKNSNIDIVLPLGLAEMGLAMAQRFAPGRLPDAQSLRDTIQSGYVGKLLDIQDGADHIVIAIEPRR